MICVGESEGRNGRVFLSVRLGEDVYVCGCVSESICVAQHIITSPIRSRTKHEPADV